MGPDEKKRRICSPTDDGPMEDEETAKQKLEEAGFEEGNFTEEEETEEGCYKGEHMTPLIHFCLTGDLKMCRFLLTKCASTTESSANGRWFPFVAAAYGGYVDVLEWLWKHGAQRNIKRTDSNGETTLAIMIGQPSDFLENDRRWTVLKWLILHGALEERPGEISYDLVEQDLGFCDRVDRRRLLSWAKEAVNTHQGFQMFLMGTLCPSAYSLSDLRNILASRLKSDDVASSIIRNTPQKELQIYWQKLQRPSPANSCLNGQPGILQQISEFVGVIRGRELSIKQQLAEILNY